MKTKQIFPNLHQRLLLYLVFLCFFGGGSGFLSAQVNSLAPIPNMPISPNASSLAVYADYPVSHYTGVPNINLPLFEVEVKGYKLPIQLNYHASGIKVSQEASWVGLGWTLQVGGAISRTIKGRDDFLEYWNDVVLKGYYEDGDITNPQDNYYYGGLLGGVLDMHLVVDTEPDIFTYSLPNGGAGKFIIDKTRGAVLMEKNASVKIEIVHDPTLGNNWRKNLCFKITEPNGTQYYYRQRETTEEHSRNGALYNNSTDPNRILDDNTRSEYDPIKYTSSWMLSRITTVNNLVVNFSYTEESSLSPTMESVTKYHRVPYYGPGAACPPTDGTIYSVKSKTRYSSLRLSGISWDEGYVTFNTSGRDDLAIWHTNSPPRKLDEIKVFDNISGLVKSIKFNYTYFNTSANGQYQHVFNRLKLEGIQIDNDPKNRYLFDYFPGELLAKNSNNVDYWGYPNGKIYGAHYYVGAVYGSDIYTGAKKSANINYAKRATLNKITYPTGGSTVFEYESNKFVNSDFALQVPNDNQSSNPDEIVEVYNEYSSIGEYEGIPTTNSFTFTVTSLTKIAMVKNIENTACPTFDPTFVYESMSSPIGRLRRVSPNPAVIKSYPMPKVNGSSSYCEYIEYTPSTPLLATHFWSQELTPGTYVFEAYTPPRDTYVRWRIALRGAPSQGEWGSVVEGGGLRIAKIIKGNQVKNFNYSPGKLIRVPVLAYVRHFGCYEYQQDGAVARSGPSLVLHSNSVIPLSSLRNGNFVGYDWVEESTVGKGKTRYYFFNETEEPTYETSFNNSAVDFPYAPTRTNFYNGLIQKIEYYKDNQLIKYMETNYTPRYSSTVRAFMYNSSNRIHQYNHRFEWPLKYADRTISKFAGNIEVEEVQKYSYNSDFQLSSTEKLVNGKWNQQKIKYARDFSDVVSQSMVSRYMIGVPLERIELKDNLVVGGEKVVYHDTLGMILPKRIFRLNVAQPLQESLYSSHYKKTVEFDRYNAKGNVLQLRDKSSLMSFLWGYRNTLPVIQARNTTYVDLVNVIQEEGLQGLDEDPTDGTIHHYTDILRTSLPDAQIVGYTHKPQIGTSSLTDARGIRTTYMYDSNSRLTEVKDHNGDIIDVYRYNYRGASLPYTRIDGTTPLLGDAWLHGNYSGQENFPGAFKVTITNRKNGTVITFNIDSSMNKSSKFPWGNYDVAVESLDGLSSSDFYFEVWGEPSTNGVLEDVHLDEDGNAFQIFIN